MRGFLDLLGRQARWALPAGVFVGIVLPDLATLLRPLLTAAVIGTLLGALLRLDWSHFATLGRRPARPLLLVAWLLVASPLLAWQVTALLGLGPELRLAVVLQSAAPPIGSAAVFALILGLDGVLAAFCTVVATLLLPLTLTPLVVLLLPEAGVRVELLPFFLRVSVLVGVPFLLAWIVRRLAGTARLARADTLLGGANVLLLVVFAISVMDGVTARLLAEPTRVAQVLVVSSAAALLLHLAGYLLFRRTGLVSAYTASVLSGNRNVGLMLVISAGTAGALFPLYVAIAQIPMYFAPLLLTPFMRWSSGGRLAR